MAAKKRPKFDSFVEFAKSQGVEFVDLDLNDDHALPPTKLHAILHKITDDVANMETDEAARRRVDNLARIVAANPAARILDKVEDLGPLLSRTEMQRVLEAATEECKGSVRVPRWLATDLSVQPEALEADLRAHSMSSPYLCKYQDACGIANAHDMAVLHSARQLSALPIDAPVTMQEYINHGGVLWKVYVIGDRHFIVKRRSLPDMDGQEEPLLFNSHRMQDIVADESEASGSDEAPDLDTVGAFCASVGRRLGLTLFGVDILRESRPGDPPGTARLFAVDVNYFPGYDGVPDFHAQLLAHVLGPTLPLKSLPLNGNGNGLTPAPLK